jgi:hypothetical protein
VQVPSAEPDKKSTLPEDFRHTLQILFRIDANGVVRRFADIDRDSVLKET